MTERETVDYILHYGSGCRDCADEDGMCPTRHLPCEPRAARLTIEQVIRALRYGIEHNYIANPFAPSSVSPKAEREEIARRVSELAVDRITSAFEWQHDPDDEDWYALGEGIFDDVITAMDEIALRSRTSGRPEEPVSVRTDQPVPTSPEGADAEESSLTYSDRRGHPCHIVAEHTVPGGTTFCMVVSTTDPNWAYIRRRAGLTRIEG